MRSQFGRRAIPRTQGTRSAHKKHSPTTYFAIMLDHITPVLLTLDEEPNIASRNDWMRFCAGGV